MNDVFVIGYRIHSVNLLLGTMLNFHEHCSIMKQNDKSEGTCCLQENVKLETIFPLPIPLDCLMTGDHFKFMGNIRRYYKAFQMTSFKSMQVQLLIGCCVDVSQQCDSMCGGVVGCRLSGSNNQGALRFQQLRVWSEL